MGDNFMVSHQMSLTQKYIATCKHFNTYQNWYGSSFGEFGYFMYDFNSFIINSIIGWLFFGTITIGTISFYNTNTHIKQLSKRWNCQMKNVYMNIEHTAYMLTTYCCFLNISIWWNINAYSVIYFYRMIYSDFSSFSFAVAVFKHWNWKRGATWYFKRIRGRQ